MVTSSSRFNVSRMVVDSTYNGMMFNIYIYILCVYVIQYFKGAITIIVESYLVAHINCGARMITLG